MLLDVTYMNRRWAHSSKISGEPGAEVTVISLLMFLSSDRGCLFHWTLCSAGFPYCCLPWRSLLGANSSYPGADLCQTTEVLLSTVCEKQGPFSREKQGLFSLLCWGH